MSIQVELPDFKGQKGYTAHKIFEEDNVNVAIGQFFSTVDDDEDMCRDMASVTVKIYGTESIDVIGGEEFSKWLVGMVKDDKDKVESSRYGLSHSEYTDESTKVDKIRTLAMREALMVIAFKPDELFDLIDSIRKDAVSAAELVTKKNIRDALGIEPHYIHVPYPVYRTVYESDYYDDYFPEGGTE